MSSFDSTETERRIRANDPAFNARFNYAVSDTPDLTCDSDPSSQSSIEQLHQDIEVQRPHIRASKSLRTVQETCKLLFLMSTHSPGLFVNRIQSKTHVTDNILFFTADTIHLVINMARNCHPTLCRPNHHCSQRRDR